MLLEDLDAAFTRGVSRDEKSTGTPVASSFPVSSRKKDLDDDGESTLSLSGLLNSLDGVAAAEGRLVLLTNLNVPDRADVPHFQLAFRNYQSH